MSKPRHIVVFISCVIALFVPFLKTFSQPVLNRVAMIDSVVVSGRKIQQDEFLKGIIAAQKDTVSIWYSCRSDTGEITENVMFRVKLKQVGDAEYIQPWNVQPKTYYNLFEGKYQFGVQAYQQTNWQTDYAIISFEINDAEAAKRKAARARADSLRQLAALQKESVQKDSLKNENQTLEKTYFTGIAIATGTGFIFLIVFLKRKAIQKFFSGKSMEQLTYEQLLAETTSLKTEIAALRGQFEALQSRGEEIHRRNKELEEKVEKITIKKNELEELQSQKDDLFAMIIHDIKNPATLIKGLVELLRSYDLTTQDQQDIMEDIMETTSRIVSLSQEVSRVMALESGKINLEIMPANIAEITRSVHRRHVIAAKAKAIDFTLDIPESDADEIEVDAQKIEEVLDNLVSNAIKFSHHGGMVRIRLSPEGANTVMEVSDNGLGLSESDIKRAFSKGARLSAQPTGGEHSSGLGLWIVKRIVEAHHGRVWVRSILGKGSTFAFQLPNSQPKAE